MLWLCLHFPLLPLEVFTRADSGAEQHAVVVIENHRVLCHNSAAGEYGIRPGISGSTAQALCSALRLRERQPARETAALLGLADWGYRFTPVLALQPPDRLLLEVSASLRLFGGLSSLLGQVEADLAARGHAHLSGLAPTPAGAELLARAMPCTHADIPPWCESPDNSLFLATLDTLPLALLEAPQAQHALMHKMGFARIGELLALPRAALGKRFGRAFLARLQRLGGEIPDPRAPHQPRQFFHGELHLLEPLHHSAALLFPMQRMLRELGQFLDRRQCYCQQLRWRFRDISGRTTSLALPCSLQHNSHEALLGLTRLALEGLRLAEPVESVALLCRRFSAVHQRSATLFQDTAEESAQAGRLLLDRLAIRLGEERIHGIGTADGHLPENAWHSTRGHEAPAPCAAITGAQRPSWLLHEPLALQQRRDGLYWNGRLQLLNGPERIESGWWAAAANRDYFIARHASGAVCWVFRERGSRHWFLHGLFG